MDKPVERPRGLSKAARLVLAAAAGVALLSFAAVPTFRRWTRAERTVALSSLRFGTVERGDLVRDASAQGKIVAALHPTLFAPAAGIVSLKVKAGDTVKRGQLLARLESPELMSRLMQEKSTLLSMQSALGRQRILARQSAAKSAQDIDVLDVKLSASERLMDRAERTFREGLLNKTDYEKAKDDLKIAQYELRNAKGAALLDKETAEFDIRDKEALERRQASVVGELTRQVTELTIGAPFAGVVASVAVQDRDSVPAAAPILMLVNLATYEVEITVPENYGADLAPGAEAQIVYEGQEYPGKVSAISPEVKDSQVKGTVVFAGASPSGLRQSQRVSVRLLFETRRGVLKLPRGPFLESGAGRSAWVVDASGVATRREIQTGVISVSEIEVARGLAEGDRVILSDTTDFGSARNVLLR
ncbi:MAG: efflux RND transporter periplasmic adaptor subunit [Thermoanaerobaculia bacterium]